MFLLQIILFCNKGNVVKNVDMIQIKMIVMVQEWLVIMDWYLRGMDIVRYCFIYNVIRLKDIEVLV